MAKADTQLYAFRQRATEFLDELDAIRSVLSPIENSGANDTDRSNFFLPFFQASPDYDITAQQLLEAVVKFRELLAWIDDPDNYMPLAKVRV